MQAMDHPFFKERPRDIEPFFAKRLKAMDPSYEETHKEMEIEAREFSRQSTLNVDEKGFSRQSTLSVDERELSRSSTLKTESPEIIKKAHRGRRSWTWAIVSQIIGFLWLVPISAVLALNINSYMIGASIWCPRDDCSTDLFGLQTIVKTRQFDSRDHNVMGVLQFASKALEVWFMFISTSLVYDVAMLLAKKGGGLPVGFLLTHLEFGDIRYLLNPLLWTSPIPHPSGSPKIRAVTGKLYIFVLLAASLTILTNLMGPATAVLVIPNLQWIEMPHEAVQVFNGTNASFAPGGPMLNSTCTDDELTAGLYNCTWSLYGAALDGFAEATESSAMQVRHESANMMLTTTQQSSVQFTLNVSASGNVIWSPSRQALREISNDLYGLTEGAMSGNVSLGGSLPPKFYNNTLGTIIQRESISLGTSSRCFLGNITTWPVDKKRGVTCMNHWQFIDENDPRSYTMCFQTGSWSDVVLENSFFVGHSSTSAHESDPMLEVRTYFSQKATYFNETDDFGTGVLECMAEKSDVVCDWEKIFNVELPEEFRNSTSNMQIVEYNLQDRTHLNARAWCDWYTYIGYSTYWYDVAVETNPLGIIQMRNLSDIGESDRPEVMHPDWLLATWSVQDGGTVNGNRPMAKALVKALPTFGLEFTFLHNYALGQASSLVDWGFGEVGNATEMASSTGPTFHRYTIIHIWAYGVSDRTSQLGIAVVLLGAVCVLVRLVLALTFRFRHEHSAVELFVAALEHNSQGEFEGLDDELELAKVRFEMVEDEEGKPRFVSERRGTGFSEMSKDGFLKYSPSSLSKGDFPAQVSLAKDDLPKHHPSPLPKEGFPAKVFWSKDSLSQHDPRSSSPGDFPAKFHPPKDGFL